jgi:hypothetical protein
MAASVPSKTSGLTDIYDEPTAMASTFMPKTYDNSQLVTTLCILTAVASALAGIFTFMKRKD